jgi:hypothetical protein
MFPKENAWVIPQSSQAFKINYLYGEQPRNQAQELKAWLQILQNQTLAKTMAAGSDKRPALQFWLCFKHNKMQQKKMSK